MDLPTKKSDGINRVMLAWRKSVTEFEEPDEEDEVQQILAYMGYGRGLVKVTQAEMSLVTSKEMQKEKPFMALLAVHNHAITIGYVGSAKSLKLMMDDPGKPWDYDQMLMKQHKPVAKALSSVSSMANVAAQIQSAADLKELVPKFKDVEAALSVLASKLIGDTMLKTLKEAAEGVQTSFEAAMGKMLEGCEVSITMPIQDFIKKYRKVHDAAMDWKMDAVGNLFEGDQAKKDFTDLHGKFEGAEKNLPVLEGFTDHRSSDTKMRSLLSRASHVYEVLKGAVASSKELASVVMICGYFLQPGNSDLTTILTHCKTMYGYDEGRLPTKLSKMIREKQAKVTDKKGKDKDTEDDESDSDAGTRHSKPSKKVSKSITKKSKKDKKGNEKHDKAKKEKKDKKEKKHKWVVG